LAATVQNELGLDPHSGLTVVFRKRCLLPIGLFVFEAGVALHSAGESGRRVEWVPRMKSRKSG
jgi:hypothetical protein